MESVRETWREKGESETEEEGGGVKWEKKNRKRRDGVRGVGAEGKGGRRREEGRGR